MRNSAILLGVVMAAGCGESGSGGADALVGADARAGVDASPAPVFDDPNGIVRITEYQFGADGNDDATGRAEAEFFAGPPNEVYATIMTEGACRMLGYDPGFCTDFCTEGYCGSDDQCHAFPTRVSAGTIVVDGLGFSLSLVPTAGINWYQPSPAQLPGELFDTGTTVDVSAAGAVFPGFELSAFGTSPVDVGLGGSQSDELRIENGADAIVSWTPADSGARVRLTIRSTTAGGHGQPLSRIIECDGPDSGELVIPRQLVEAFPAMERTEMCVAIDCPPSSFLRYHSAVEPAGDGVVKLMVGNQVDFLIVHPD